MTLLYRPATEADMPSVMEAVDLLLAGSVFDNYSMAKVRRIIAGGIYYNEFVFDGARVVGFMAGVIGENHFTDERHAWDLGLFVRPEHRGGTMAVRLLRNFERWAKAGGARFVWQTQSVGHKIGSTTLFYSRMGYVCQGANTCKELK